MSPTRRQPVLGRIFDVTYTNGATGRTETAVLAATEIERLDCGCDRVSFDRPGGWSASLGATPTMEAFTGCSSHPKMCTEIIEPRENTDAGS